MIHKISSQNKQAKCTQDGINIKPNIFKIWVALRGSVALNSYVGEEEDPTPLMHNSTSKKGEKELAMFETSWKVVYAYNSALRTLRQNDHKLHMNLGCLTKRKHDYLKQQIG